MENQLVVFNLANENYGVDIAAVDGIVKMQQITSVPHAPSFVEGITNLRGEVLPVIDLRKRFGLPQGDTTKETRIVNVDVDGVKIGMVVDAVSEVLRVSEEDIEPPSPIVITTDDDAASLKGIRNTFITGIAKVGDGPDSPGRLIILLNLAKVLSTEEQTDLQAMQHLQAPDEIES
ncbi:MAG: chemotaxis protein CheW [Chloroflexi bacterium]|nr:chemotaxis protein CheW [Chloroflexota bacterium]